VLPAFATEIRSSLLAAPVADAEVAVIGVQRVQEVQKVHPVQRVRLRTTRDVAAGTRLRHPEPGAWSPEP